jgi:hypothetical protein
MTVKKKRYTWPTHGPKLDRARQRFADAVRALGGEASASAVAKHLRESPDRTFRMLEGAVRRKMLTRIYRRRIAGTPRRSEYYFRSIGGT